MSNKNIGKTIHLFLYSTLGLFFFLNIELKYIVSASLHCLNISDRISLTALCLPAPLASRCYSHGKVETDEEFDARWVTYFSKPDLDAWELRKGEFDT